MARRQTCNSRIEVFRIHVVQFNDDSQSTHICSIILIWLHIGLLSPTCGRRPWSGDYKNAFCTCMHPCVHECVRSSRFCINLYISFIYSFIFTKFAGNVYGYENLSLKNFSLILKNKMAAIANFFENCKGALNLEIFQLASTNLHKRYMARKASLIVILA